MATWCTIFFAFKACGMRRVTRPWTPGGGREHHASHRRLRFLKPLGYMFRR
ncbi:expressed unknown protein [Ectocarpus siliculosus]|uniref:Uncharacterized protein n=1 Tax=Ectocarpus siliculosus TaxID=2880 RepID=D7FRL7_ECTSI|nr:expressed unknown protein [Ectocarpus siliculosus]|eukprot:CBJ30808.1 expressed unknown protein [Ectocarpus siliculosus]